jgi:DNA-directed RNA polymerase specialized sigma subunit, sigma24 homolog
MRRRDLSKVSIADAERRMRIALAKMSERQGDILLAIRFDDASYDELAERHGISAQEVAEDFARALGTWSRCLNARLPWFVWPWL